MSDDEVSCQKRYRGHWWFVVLAIGLSLLIASGIGVDVASRVDPGAAFDWYLQPVPRHLVIVHYGRNTAYMPKTTMSPHVALLSTRAEHYVLSVYIQMPGRRWSHFWLL